MKLKFLFSALAILTAAALLAATAIHRSSKSSPAIAPQTFQVHGQVRSVDLASRTVRIAHEAIPDYMPAMTMALPLKDPSLLKDLAPGDDVQFELSVTDDDSWISHISKIVTEKQLGANATAGNTATAAPED